MAKKMHEQLLDNPIMSHERFTLIYTIVYIIVLVRILHSYKSSIHTNGEPLVPNRAFITRR